MTAKEKIEKARVGLILDHPFFGSLILRLTMVEKSEMLEKRGMPTMATDGKNIYYHIGFVEKLSQEEVKGVLVHEIFHPMFQHHTRRNSRDPMKWNIACDLAINGLIEDSGIKLPKDRLREKQYDGKHAEEIYNMLPEPPKMKIKMKGGDGSGQQDNQDPGGCGAVIDIQGPDGETVSAAEVARAEQEWRIAVSQAAQQAKRQGKLPAGLEKFIDEIVNPSIDWRDVLRRFVSQVAKNDYTWMPPNRRYIHRGLYLPSVKSQDKLNLIFAWDASGSMWDKDIVNQAAAEATGIMEDFAAEMKVIYHDAIVQKVDEYDSENLPIKFSPKGGGGTDFACVFEYIRKNGLKPDCMVFFTDLMGSMPDFVPDYPVLWAHVGDYNDQVPFGEVVKITLQ